MADEGRVQSPCDRYEVTNGAGVCVRCGFMDVQHQASGRVRPPLDTSTPAAYAVGAGLPEPCDACGEVRLTSWVPNRGNVCHECYETAPARTPSPDTP